MKRLGHEVRLRILVVCHWDTSSASGFQSCKRVARSRQPWSAGKARHSPSEVGCTDHAIGVSLESRELRRRSRFGVRLSYTIDREHPSYLPTLHPERAWPPSSRRQPAGAPVIEGPTARRTPCAPREKSPVVLAPRRARARRAGRRAVVLVRLSRRPKSPGSPAGCREAFSSPAGTREPISPMCPPD